MSGRLFVVVVVVGEREKVSGTHSNTDEILVKNQKNKKKKTKLGDCKTIDREKKVFSAD